MENSPKIAIPNTLHANLSWEHRSKGLLYGAMDLNGWHWDFFRGLSVAAEPQLCRAA